MAGRHRTPDIIKEIRGTDRQDRANKDQPIFDIVTGLSNPPEEWNDYAKTEYKRVVLGLSKVGLLQDVDMSLIAAYCLEMGTYLDCKDIIRKKGYSTISDTGVEKPRAEVVIANQSLTQAYKIAAKFGFSPVDRQKITTANAKEEKQDPLMKALNMK